MHPPAPHGHRAPQGTIPAHTGVPPAARGGGSGPAGTPQLCQRKPPAHSCQHREARSKPITRCKDSSLGGGRTARQL